MALIVALIVGTTYWQTWARPGLAARQDNEIQRVAEFQVRRGLILAPGRVLARNRVVTRNGRKLYFRRYPQGRLAAHVVGYSTVSRARAGLEKSLNGVLTGTEREPRRPGRAAAGRGSGQADRRRHRRHDARPPRAAGGARAARQDVRGGRRRSTRASGKLLVMASSPSYNPNLVENDFGEDLEDHCRLPPCRAARQPRLPGPLPAGLDVQGRHGVGGARVEPLLAGLGVRRPRLLHRLRQARQQLRHEPAVRAALARDGAQVLRQLRVLQHRQGARREADPRPGEEVRLLRAAAARDAGRRALPERALPERRALVSEARTRTSTRAGWRSGRSACS